MTENYADVPIYWPRALNPTDDPLQWAKENCPSYITNDAVGINGVYHYRFYFGNSKDCTAFILKWGDHVYNKVD